MIQDNIIERREYKYIVSKQTAEEIRRLIEPFCEPDPNVDPETGKYLIDSIYFDTDELTLFQENEHETMDRVKLRVRGYPAGDHKPVFLEVKRRVNDVIEKSRGKVSIENWGDILDNPRQEWLESLPDENRRAVDRFLFYYHTMHAHPVVLVRYEREPYFSTIDDYARVTFDRKIRSKSRDYCSFGVGNSDWRYIDDPIAMRSEKSMVVLELKFVSSNAPRWMSDIVKKVELDRLSFSKYGRSVLAWHTSPEERLPAA